MVVIAIIPLLIVVFLVAASALAVWRGVTLPRGSGGAPACGSCGYAVADLTSFTCPECGGDLREVGIKTPAQEARRRGSLTGALAGWTFLCVLLAYFAVLIIAETGSYPPPPSVIVYDWNETLAPKSGAFQSVSITVSASDFRHIQPIEIELTGLGGEKHVHALVADTMLFSEVGSEPVAWSPEALADWFVASGVSLGDPAVASEVFEFGEFVEVVAHSPGRSPGGQLPAFTTLRTWHTQSTSAPPASGPNPYILAASYIGVPSVYLGGIVLIVRRRRRLLGLGVIAPTTPPQASTQSR